MSSTIKKHKNEDTEKNKTTVDAKTNARVIFVNSICDVAGKVRSVRNIKAPAITVTFI